MYRFNLAVRWPDGMAQGFVGTSEMSDIAAESEAYRFAHAERPGRERFEVISEAEINLDSALRSQLEREWSCF